MFKSHLRAGTGAVLVETREEARLIREVCTELDGAEICHVAAPNGAMIDAVSGAPAKGQGLSAGYKWLADSPGRVLVVFDYHPICNGAVSWRALIESLPSIRNPRGSGEGDTASLVIFCGPSWELSAQNPLRGALPILSLDAPSRQQLIDVASGLCKVNGETDAVADALCGLSADRAEQVCAEVLSANGMKWNVDALRGAQRQALKEGGLELWQPVSELGGLSGLRSFVDSELIPWVRDSQLSVRRLLCAGVPGVGKSYCARWISSRLNCLCTRLSIPSLKAGIVGSSEANLRRALRTVDNIAAHSPMVVVLDEIDTIAREGMDGGTSSGMFAELLTWLQESTSQAIVLATLNRLDKLDAALESRFSARFFFDLPSHGERQAVAAIHYARLCCITDNAAKTTADNTDGFSSREIAEQVCPSVARQTSRKPDASTISKVCASITPASKTQAEQLKAMRNAASTLQPANDAENEGPRTGRRIGGAN